MSDMKDSGIEWIGEIPKRKYLVRNKYLLEYIKGKLPDNTNSDGIGTAYIGASDLDSNGSYKIYTTDETLPDSCYNDLLVLWDGARAGLCGTHKIGKISSTIVRIREQNAKIYRPFLYWYYKGFEDYMYQRVNGTTIPHMNKKYIEEIQFINWTIQEQQYISNYLDCKCSQIDTIIAKQQEVIEKLKEYKLSMITEAVTKGLNPDVPMKDSGIKWIGKIPEHWILNKFKYISLDIGDGIHTTPTYDLNGNVYFINGNNIGNDYLVFKEDTNTINDIEYSLYKLPILTKDTVLITLNGATYGKTSFYHGERILLGKSAGFITLKSAENKEFIRYYLQSHTARYIMDLSLLGSTIANLSLRTIRDFLIPYPPIKEQLEIVSYLNLRIKNIDISIAKKEELIEKFIKYKKSLIYEVVTGKKEV